MISKAASDVFSRSDSKTLLRNITQANLTVCEWLETREIGLTTQYKAMKSPQLYRTSEHVLRTACV